MLRPLLLLFVSAVLLCNIATAAESRPISQQLAELGEVSASPYSLQQEYDLGRLWLKMFRTQVTTVDDPQLQSYLESLLYNLAANSELKQRQLETVIVDRPISTNRQKATFITLRAESLTFSRTSSSWVLVPRLAGLIH